MSASRKKIATQKVTGSGAMVYWSAMSPASGFADGSVFLLSSAMVLKFCADGMALCSSSSSRKGTS